MSCLECRQRESEVWESKQRGTNRPMRLRDTKHRHREGDPDPGCSSANSFFIHLAHSGYNHIPDANIGTGGKKMTALPPSQGPLKTEATTVVLWDELKVLRRLHGNMKNAMNPAVESQAEAAPCTLKLPMCQWVTI